MKNRNLKLIVFTTIIGFFLTACGGGGSGGTSPATAVMVPSSGTALADVTGKTIKKIENGAEVRIVHTSDAKGVLEILCQSDRVLNSKGKTDKKYIQFRIGT